MQPQLSAAASAMELLNMVKSAALLEMDVKDLVNQGLYYTFTAYPHYMFMSAVSVWRENVS